MARWTKKYIDHSRETGTVDLYVQDMGANTIADYALVLAPLHAAIDGVTLLNSVESRIIALETEHGEAPPANKNAQKEIAWTVHFQDDVTGRNYVRTIPGADMTLTQANSDLMDLSAGAGLALKTQWDALVESQDGNATTLLYVELKK